MHENNIALFGIRIGKRFLREAMLGDESSVDVVKHVSPDLANLCNECG
jgi:hypothetical protein